MECITIYPVDEKQKSLIKSLLEEMKVKFEIGKNQKDSILSEEEFYNKIDRSIEQVNAGNIKIISEKEQNELVGSI